MVSWFRSMASQTPPTLLDTLVLKDEKDLTKKDVILGMIETRDKFDERLIRLETILMDFDQAKDDVEAVKNKLQRPGRSSMTWSLLLMPSPLT